jgi:rod shape-determining protein MreD
MISPLTLHRWAFVMLFLVLSILIVFTRILPLGPATGVMPPPDAIVLLGFAWVLRRPDFVPVLLFAAILLVTDLLFLRTPGLATALAVIGLEWLRARAGQMRERGFLVEWATVAAVLGLMLLAERVVLALLFVPEANLGLAVFGLAVNILFYPVIAGLSVWGFRVRRLAPGEHAAEARLI